MGLLPHDCHKQPFATTRAGNEPINRLVEALKQRTRDVPFGLDALYGQHLGSQFLHEVADVLFVLLRIKGTGTIYYQATFLQALPGVTDYFTLQSPTLLHVLRAPLADGGRILAEHAFARTGNVAEDEGKPHPALDEVAGVEVGDAVVLVAPLADVFGQYLTAFAVRLVASEQPLLGQHRAQQCRFAAGGSAKVEGSGGLSAEGGVLSVGERPPEKHRCGFLYVVAACMQQGVHGELGATAEVVTVRTPGHRFTICYTPFALL